jgi:splicing factor 3A subunit 2
MMQANKDCLLVYRSRRTPSRLDGLATASPKSATRCLLFQFQFPDITAGTIPRVRFMSAYEQRVEEADPNYQYFIVAGEPYETVAVKLQAREVDRREGKFWTWFDEDNKEFWCQLLFKTERDERFSAVPGLAPGRK